MLGWAATGAGRRTAVGALGLSRAVGASGGAVGLGALDRVNDHERRAAIGQSHAVGETTVGEPGGLHAGARDQIRRVEGEEALGPRIVGGRDGARLREQRGGYERADKDGTKVDIGRVGEVVGCHMEYMDAAHKAGIVPVISPLASELATGKPLNINADLAAAALAKELRVAKLVYLSDVPGLLSDPKDPSTLIKSVTRKEADALIADGTISGGMIPKIRSAVDALNAGVRKVHFVDGRLPHALLLEIFTDKGIGTEIVHG